MRRTVMPVLLTLVLATAVVADEPPAGTFRLDVTSSDDVNGAINAVVKKMNFLTRSIARSRLRKTNPAYDQISLAFTGSSARITAGPGSPVVLPMSGAPVQWKRDDGETFTVSGQMQNGSYVETFDANDGRRTNVFSGAPGGGVTMNVTVTSPRLPAPLRYRLVYKKT